jgi:trehalose 6-phosphate phosphatase
LAKNIEAVIFDLDGVITKTAKIHALAWKSMFDEFLSTYSQKKECNLTAFEIERDYYPYIDGIPRVEGIKNFLNSRGIILKEGEIENNLEAHTIYGLSRRKNRIFQQLIQERGVEIYPDTLQRMKEWKAEGLKLGVISSSKNCRPILKAIDLERFFDTIVDGVTSEQLNILGKPAPDIFLKAADNMNADPLKTIVIEDAILGVEAGKRGGFQLVIGVDRAGIAKDLKAKGADIVVQDMCDKKIDKMLERKSVVSTELKNGLKEEKDFYKKIVNKKLAVFLDYDGTLTPIASRPSEALMEEGMRETVKILSEFCHVAVISGRDLQNVKEMVKIEGLVYAGSHGFDIEGPGIRMQHENGKSCRPAFEKAEKELLKKLNHIKGAEVERKLFAIAVHYRHVEDNQIEELESIVRDVVEDLDGIKLAPGKKIIELKPDVDWHKGRALQWLLKELDLGENVMPIYLGDDMTDEDAFSVLDENGIGILVGHHGSETYADYLLEDQEEVKEFLQKLSLHLKNKVHERMEN